MMVWTEVISNCSKLVTENVIRNDDDRVLHNVNQQLNI